MSVGVEVNRKEVKDANERRNTMEIQKRVKRRNRDAQDCKRRASGSAALGLAENRGVPRRYFLTLVQKGLSPSTNQVFNTFYM